jgi:hypothetical protein
MSQIGWLVKRAVFSQKTYFTTREGLVHDKIFRGSLLAPLRQIFPRGPPLTLPQAVT